MNTINGQIILPIIYHYLSSLILHIEFAQLYFTLITENLLFTIQVSIQFQIIIKILFMQDTKKIESIVQGEVNHSKQNIFQKSPYQEQYKKVLETIEIKPLQEYIDQLSKNNIFYDPSYFNSRSIPNLSIKIVKANQYGSYLTLLVAIGPFTLNIEVANAYVTSQTHSVGCQQFGRLGDVYFVQRQGAKSAIKCFRYKPKVFHDFQMATRKNQNQENGEQVKNQAGDFWGQSFVNCLKQYCFYKIFDALEIGPKIKKILGFDIVCYENCFEFSIEICIQSYKQSNHDSEKELLYCLKVMHLFHIVHRDIKPQNILFSPQRNRLVLIDFDVTSIIKQETGCSTLYQYVVGTYGFFCKEMQQRYEMFLQGKQAQPTQIDFYYNDLFGIRKSVQAIYSLDYSGKKNFPICKKLSEINLAIWIGSLIQNEKLVDFTLYRQNIQVYANWILDFTRNYSYSLKQQQTLKTFIMPFIKKNQQISQYTGRFYLKVYQKLQKMSQIEISQMEEKKSAQKNLQEKCELDINEEQTKK